MRAMLVALGVALWAALAVAQPALNLNGEPLTALRCDGGVVCVRRGTVAYVYGSGSSGGSSSPAPPVDAGFVVWSAAASSGSTNERVLTAGANVTISTATPGQVVISASSGGGGSLNTATGTVTFDGGALDALATVTAAWATPSSVIFCTPVGEEASVEGLVTTVTTKGSGSFVVRAEPRNGTHWGAMPFECIGN